MSAEPRLGPRHWLAAVAAAALVHALAIAAFEAGTTRGWLGADGAGRRSAAAGRRLRVSLSMPDPGNSAPARPPAAETRLSEAAALPKPQPRVRPPTQIATSRPRSPLAEATPDRVESRRAAPESDPSRTHDGSGADGGIGEMAEIRAANHSGPSTGTGGPSAVDYFATLHERVSRVHDYPRRARRRETEGTVLLSIRIDRQGRVASCRVRESSGSAVLDRHAVQTIGRAAPFGAVPDGVADADLDFDLPLEYQLR